MSHCFEPCDNNDHLAHYLDDFLIPADDIEEMLKRIEEFLRQVVKFRIKLAPDKSVFFAREITFLGYILNNRGVKKSPEYVERIKHAPRPETVHDMMKFLGLVNFQRRFVPHCSELLAPLNAAIEIKGRNIKRTKIV